MRVLYFTRDYTTHDRRFLAAIAAAGHETFFLRLEDDGVVYEPRPLPDGVRAIDWPGGTRPAAGVADWMALMPHLEQVIADVKPDVLHAGPVHSCGFLAALSAFRPLVVMSWGSDLLVDAEIATDRRWMAGFALRHANTFVCDCDAVQRKARALAPALTGSRVVQFPWGVDVSEHSPSTDPIAARRALSIPDEAFVVLSTRMWEPHYGISTVIDAVALARARWPHVFLLLLGEGSLAGEVRRHAEALGVSVRLPGIVSQERLPGYYQAADIYVSAAHNDGSSISLLEAMATGLPVAATDAGGNAEWVTPDAAGQLVPVGDVEALAAAIEHFARMGRAECRRLGAVNRDIVLRRADWRANAVKLLDAYDRLVPAPVPGRV